MSVRQSIRTDLSPVARAVPLFALLLLGGCNRLSILDPAGPVGAQEKQVILIAFALMLIVVIPVFVMTFLFAWRYRASRKGETYSPKWAESRTLEVVVWFVPALIVISLGILTWNTTHELSPYRPLVSAQRPLRIEAVSMNWKWLFIYPDQHIATVNQLVIPTGVPVSFRLTSATVMTSFFIPRLGSQIYAMPGMRTRLHLLADKAGTYSGRNFQFSGPGYASMHFTVEATSMNKFDDWVNRVRKAPQALDDAALKSLEKPSRNQPVMHYASVRPHLFDRILRRFRTADAKRQPPAPNGS